MDIVNEFKCYPYPLEKFFLQDCSDAARQRAKSNKKKKLDSELKWSKDFEEICKTVGKVTQMSNKNIICPENMFGFLTGALFS